MMGCMRIAVVGARLAGSYASLLLSRLGHEILLFDESLLDEKPCGGGVTAKALRNISWFRQNPLPHTEIKTMRMVAANGCSADLKLEHPIHIFSRMVLDSSIRQGAENMGTRLIPERCLRITRHKTSWVVSTPSQEYEADFLVGADGATSRVRSCTAGKYTAKDVSLALGFYVPGVYHQDTLVTVFQETGFRGYIWSFPRVDHSSVGILHWLPGANASQLRERVIQFIAARYPGAVAKMCFYAARIPCLSRERLIQQCVCGENWALLGDAAGFVDAITAEGIYYALRSAELLAECIAKGRPLEYEVRWRQDFGSDLAQAARWRDRFYCGRFLLQAFTQRAVQATRYSPVIQELTDKLISGLYAYETMRRQMILKSPRILIEALAHRLRRSSRTEPEVFKSSKR